MEEVTLNQYSKDSVTLKRMYVKFLGIELFMKMRLNFNVKRTQIQTLHFLNFIHGIKTKENNLPSRVSPWLQGVSLKHDNNLLKLIFFPQVTHTWFTSAAWCALR